MDLPYIKYCTLSVVYNCILRTNLLYHTKGTIHTPDLYYDAQPDIGVHFAHYKLSSLQAYLTTYEAIGSWITYCITGECQGVPTYASMY